MPTERELRTPIVLEETEVNMYANLESSYQKILPRITAICDHAVEYEKPRYCTANMLKAIAYATTGGSTWFQCLGCDKASVEIKRLYVHTDVAAELITNLVTFVVNGQKRMVHFSVEPDNVFATAKCSAHNRKIGVNALAAVRFGMFEISGKQFFRNVPEEIKVATFREFVACEPWQARWACKRFDALMEQAGKEDPLVAFSLWEDGRDERVNSYGYKIEVAYRKIVHATGER